MYDVSARRPRETSQLVNRLKAAGSSSLDKLNQADIVIKHSYFQKLDIQNQQLQYARDVKLHEGFKSA